MKLINADNINFHCNYNGDCTGDIEDCKECENYICDFRDIQEQPIAYDIDKVVEELKELKNKDVCNDLDCDACLYKNICGVEADQSSKLKLDKVIETVEQGVVSDDVCECKLIEGYKFLYKTSCGNVFEIKNGFKYCPYCRKRISEVKQ